MSESAEHLEVHGARAAPDLQRLRRVLGRSRRIAVRDQRHLALQEREPAVLLAVVAVREQPVGVAEPALRDRVVAAEHDRVVRQPRRGARPPSADRRGARYARNARARASRLASPSPRNRVACAQPSSASACSPSASARSKAALASSQAPRPSASKPGPEVAPVRDVADARRRVATAARATDPG